MSPALLNNPGPLMLGGKPASTAVNDVIPLASDLVDHLSRAKPDVDFPPNGGSTSGTDCGDRAGAPSGDPAIGSPQTSHRPRVGRHSHDDRPTSIERRATQRDPQLDQRGHQHFSHPHPQPGRRRGLRQSRGSQRVLVRTCAAASLVHLDQLSFGSSCRFPTRGILRRRSRESHAGRRRSHPACVADGR